MTLGNVAQIFAIILLFGESFSSEKTTGDPNPLKIHVNEAVNGLLKFLPEEMTRDLKGDTIDNVGKIVQDKNVVACTKKIMNHLQHPSSSSIPACVKKDDLEALNEILQSVKELPRNVGPECINVLSGKFGGLQECQKTSWSKIQNIALELLAIINRMNVNCRAYLRENKSAIQDYCKKGCKGELKI